MPAELKALIWDVDGTIAETERDGHRVAFNRAFEALGLRWHWSVQDYGPLLNVAGGRERILHDMVQRADSPASVAERDALARELHRRKNAIYAELVDQGAIQARPGVLRLMDECEAAGVRLAIATTTSGSNVRALFARLFGAPWRERFAVLICAEEAPVKKPDPLAYQLTLQALDMAAREAFALEDSPNGLQAARSAGITCGVTRSAYFADADFSGAAWVRDDLDAPPSMTLARLREAVSVNINGNTDSQPAPP